MNIDNYIQNIPEELKIRNQWICFKIEKSLNRNGQNIIKKIPFSAKTFSAKEWNKRENWSSFEEVLKVLKSSNYDGISFVLTEDDPYICIDLDDVKDKVKEEFLREFGNTYIEISYSGKGIHIFSKGNIDSSFNNREAKVEMYKSNKCIAITGNLLTKNIVLNKQNEIDKCYKNFAPRKTTIGQIEKFKRDSMPLTQEDIPCASEIVDIMCKVNTRARDLFFGMYSTGDLSRDDFQLLLLLNSFCHGDPLLMKEIFLSSSLNRMGDRSKRTSEIAYLRYLNESIKKAISVGTKDYWKYRYRDNYHKKREVIL